MIYLSNIDVFPTYPSPTATNFIGIKSFDIFICICICMYILLNQNEM